MLPAEGPLARRPATLADLSAAPWVMDPASSSPGRWQRAMCHAARFKPDVRFVSPDYLLHVHLVETGHAVAMLPDLLWTERRSTVQRVELPGRPRRRLYTGVRTGAAAHPAVRAFRESLRAMIGRNTGGPPLTEAELRPLRQVSTEAAPRLEVTASGQVRLATGDGPGRLADGLAGLLLTIRDAQSDGSWDRMKLCGNPDCLWAFYDRSHSRQGAWCDMASCGNRLKNRSLRARRAQAG